MMGKVLLPLPLTPLSLSSTTTNHPQQLPLPPMAIDLDNLHYCLYSKPIRCQSHTHPAQQTRNKHLRYSYQILQWHKSAV